jgi:hypothetical protein
MSRTKIKNLFYSIFKTLIIRLVIKLKKLAKICGFPPPAAQGSKGQALRVLAKTFY